MKQMKCGGCGCETAKVEAEGCNPYSSQIDLICAKCGSRTSLRLRVQIETEETGNEIGAFCVGWDGK